MVQFPFNIIGGLEVFYFFSENTVNAFIILFMYSNVVHLVYSTQYHWHKQ